VALAVAGGVFVMRALVHQWGPTRRALEGADARWVAAAAVLAALGMVWVAAMWPGAQALVGPALRRPDGVALYFQGEVAKYVPGGLWAVVGRAELARRRGLAAATAYAGVVLSLAGLYLAAALTGAVLIPFEAGRGRVLGAVGVAVLAAGLTALHPNLLGRVLAVAGRRLRTVPGVEVPAWRRSAALVLRYLPAWVVIGSSTWCLARALTPSARYGEVVGGTAVAWLAGFLAVPVPGGVGVREATFVAAVPGLPAGVAAAVALTARVAFMATDGLGAALASFVQRGRESPPPPAGSGPPPSSTAGD
jgi:uncharacterized membrane protein YbhN (UPF0104 family)